MLKRIGAGVLDVAYEEAGPASGPRVILLHGFPYDIRAYDEVAPLLAAAGHRVLVPYLRGYGATRFLAPETPRSGQQAVLGADLLAFMDALAIPSALLAGYDWGGRAACIVAALWPERARGLVTVNGYNIQNIAASGEPAMPEDEHRYWYQYYFHGERGRAGLIRNRRALCRLLWRLWSPNWRFDDATFERSAPSFDNPDFASRSSSIPTATAMPWCPATPRSRRSSGGWRPGPPSRCRRWRWTVAATASRPPAAPEAVPAPSLAATSTG